MNKFWKYVYIQILFNTGIVTSHNTMDKCRKQFAILIKYLVQSGPTIVCVTGKFCVAFDKALNKVLSQTLLPTILQNNQIKCQTFEVIIISPFVWSVFNRYSNFQSIKVYFA